jgi:hypothetical protein
MLTGLTIRPAPQARSKMAFYSWQGRAREAAESFGMLTSSRRPVWGRRGIVPWRRVGKGDWKDAGNMSFASTTVHRKNMPAGLRVCSKAAIFPIALREQIGAWMESQRGETLGAGILARESPEVGNTAVSQLLKPVKAGRIQYDLSKGSQRPAYFAPQERPQWRPGQPAISCVNSVKTTLNLPSSQVMSGDSA